MWQRPPVLMTQGESDHILVPSRKRVSGKVVENRRKAVFERWVHWALVLRHAPFWCGNCDSLANISTLQVTDPRKEKTPPSFLLLNLLPRHLHTTLRSATPNLSSD